MSFSDEVRSEICTALTDKDKRFACLYGMLLFSRTLSADKICFQSKSSITADTFGELFRRVFHEEIKCRTTDRTLYIYDIRSKELIERVFAKYHFDGISRHIEEELISTGSLGIFTAGAFLAGGSINEPEKGYHLEFIAPDETIAAELSALLADIGVTAGLTDRRSQHIVYIKGSESIEDTLTFIGAQRCTLELMNIKIYKDVRNKVNRQTNCDNANISKTVNAAVKQMEDIRLIASTIGLNALSDELREVAELRLDNSEMSLQEMGDSLSEPISRSGVNHRLKRLAKIAEDIRKAEKSHET